MPVSGRHLHRASNTTQELSETLQDIPRTNIHSNAQGTNSFSLTTSEDRGPCKLMPP